MESDKKYSTIISYKSSLGSENKKAYTITGVVVFACIYSIYDSSNEISFEAIFFNLIFVAAAYFLSFRKLKKFKINESYIFISKAFLKDEKIEDYKKEIIYSSALKILNNAIYEKDKYYLNEKFRINVDSPEPLTGLEASQFWIARLIQKDHLITAKLEYSSLVVNHILLTQERSIKYEKMERESILRAHRSAEREANSTNKTFDEVLTKRLQKFENLEKEKEKSKEELKTKNTLSTIKLITGTCPYCLKKIPKLATKCSNCTADF